MSTLALELLLTPALGAAVVASRLDTELDNIGTVGVTGAVVVLALVFQAVASSACG